MSIIQFFEGLRKTKISQEGKICSLSVRAETSIFFCHWTTALLVLELLNSNRDISSASTPSHLLRTLDLDWIALLEFLIHYLVHRRYKYMYIYIDINIDILIHVDIYCYICIKYIYIFPTGSVSLERPNTMIKLLGYIA